MPNVLASTTAFYVIAMLCVAARLYARIVLVKHVYGEDNLIVCSSIVATSWWIAKVIGEVKNANEDVVVLRIVAWWGTAAWALASGLTKMSIVWQYRRIFPTRWVRRSCNGLLIFLLIYTLYSFFAAVFICIPVRAGFYDKGRCMSDEAYYYPTAVVNILCDVVIFVLPVQPILSLKIGQRQKFALLFCFTFGFFVIIASIFRLYELSVTFSHPYNLNAINLSAIWAGIEMMSSIICACITVMRPLFGRLLPRILGSSGYGTGRHSKQKGKSFDFQDASPAHNDEERPGSPPLLQAPGPIAAPDAVSIPPTPSPGASDRTYIRDPSALDIELGRMNSGGSHPQYFGEPPVQPGPNPGWAPSPTYTYPNPSMRAQ